MSPCPAASSRRPAVYTTVTTRMNLTTLDWVIVAVSVSAAFIPALFFARRGGSSTSEFFTSGRAAPWWLIGVSMVATTFSTDTPNLVTDLVRQKGVANNWAWWSFLLTGMLTVFFYARMWRRSKVLTDLEFYEIRYSGKPATFVRGFRAVYLGLVFNCFIMATVNLAAVKIANVLLGWPMTQTLVVCAVINVLFAATSGLWGVLVAVRRCRWQLQPLASRAQPKAPGNLQSAICNPSVRQKRGPSPARQTSWSSHNSTTPGAFLGSMAGA